MRDYEAVLKQARTCANRKYCDIGGNCEYYDAGVCCQGGEKDILNDAADAIEELVAAVPKWISVEERLPEENQDVLLRFEHNMVVGFWQMYSGDRIWCANSGDELYVDCAVVEGYDTPTHWMPLPEPPKEVLPNGEV